MSRLSVHVRREQPGLCGPYALSAVLRFHGDHAPLSTLVRLCRATRARGTKPESLAAAARARGLRIRVKRWAELSDLAASVRAGLPPLVLWFSEVEGHYSVVVGLDRQNVFLADPELGRVRRLPRRVFRQVWFDFATSGPEKGAKLYARWMLVVKPERARKRRRKNQSALSLGGPNLMAKGGE